MSENFKSIRTTLVAMLLLLGGVVAQAQTVKVNVKDSSGEAVIGASVIEKDTRNGGWHTVTHKNDYWGNASNIRHLSSTFSTA